MRFLLSENILKEFLKFVKLNKRKIQNNFELQFTSFNVLQIKSICSLKGIKLLYPSKYNQFIKHKRKKFIYNLFQNQNLKNKKKETVQLDLTKSGKKDKRYLNWCSMCIITRKNNDFGSYIYKIDFSNKKKYKNVKFHHIVKFVIASAGSSGIVFGSKFIGNRPSFVHFYSLNCNTTKVYKKINTWDIILPQPESVQVNCVCDECVIIGTNTNMLRIFSIGGIEEAIILIPGKLITSCSYGFFFAIIFEKKNKSGLMVRIYDTKRKKILVETEVCLSLNSKLKWCQFSDKQILMTIDTKNIIRGLFPNWSWTWTPLLNLSKGTKLILWPIFVDGMKIYCAEIKKNVNPLQNYIYNTNYPKLEAFNFKLPVCKFLKDEKGELRKLTEEILRSELFIEINNIFSSKNGLKKKSLLEKKNNKTKILLFQKLIEVGLLDTAFVVSKTITSIKILKKIINVANFFNQFSLAEKINKFLLTKKK